MEEVTETADAAEKTAEKERKVAEKLADKQRKLAEKEAEKQRKLADNPGRGSLLIPVSHHGSKGFWPARVVLKP